MTKKKLRGDPQKVGFADGSSGGLVVPSILPRPPGALSPWSKDGGVRPIVVGELVSAIVAKLALKEAESSIHVLQPLQIEIGVVGKGPVIQAAILRGKIMGPTRCTTTR